MAFSILYDPDETLNFIAPNKYEVSLGGPSLLPPQALSLRQEQHFGLRQLSCWGRAAVPCAAAGWLARRWGLPLEQPAHPFRWGQALGGLQSKRTAAETALGGSLKLLQGVQFEMGGGQSRQWLFLLGFRIWNHHRSGTTVPWVLDPE